MSPGRKRAAGRGPGVSVRWATKVGAAAAQKQRTGKMGAANARICIYLLRDADPAFDALDERWSDVLSDDELARACRFRFARQGLGGESKGPRLSTAASAAGTLRMCLRNA